MLGRALDFIRHWLTAKTRHGIHSPFVYSFIDKCVYAESPMLDARITRYFQALKSSRVKLYGPDHGNQGEMRERTIGDYAKTSSIQDFQASLLHKLVSYFNADRALELGTNLGKATASMAKGNDVRITSVEGNAAIYQVALENLKTLEITNVELVNATFEDYLDSSFQSFDLVFVDGNHHYTPTISYFNQLKQRINKGGVMIFHDIYWSDEMKKAWSEIKKDRDVSVSLDLFFLGIVWLNRNQEAEHFKVRFPMHPWLLLF